MNKLMVASLSLLLAGAAALPAQAQEQRRWEGEASGQPGQLGTSDAERAEARQERGEDRQERSEERQERGEMRQERGEVRQERGEGRREVVREELGERREWQADGRRGQPGQLGLGNVVEQARPEQAYDRHADRRDDRRDDRHDRRDWRDDRRDDNRYDDHYGRNDSRYDNRYDNHHDNRYDNRYDGRRYDVSRYSRHDDRRWHGNHWYPQYRYRAPVHYVYPRGYRAYQWRVGNRLPSSYYGSNYYVDYNAYRLPPPPYGYHWVRVDRDVVLVSIASGLIRDILYGLYY